MQQCQILTSFNIFTGTEAFSSSDILTVLGIFLLYSSSKKSRPNCKKMVSSTGRSSSPHLHDGKLFESREKEINDNAYLNAEGLSNKHLVLVMLLQMLCWSNSMLQN